MQLEQIEIDKLIPYARNSRKHSDEQIMQVAASIKEFGFLNPVIIDKDNGIVAGHCRVLAAHKLSIDTIPCVRADHLTESQKRAYVIVDNNLALNSEWDEEMLSLEIGDLKDADFDLDLIGFDDDFFNDVNSGKDIATEIDGIDYVEQLQVVINCDSEEDQELIYNQMEKRGFKCKILSI